jgi:hypothetical protein
MQAGNMGKKLSEEDIELAFGAIDIDGEGTIQFVVSVFRRPSIILILCSWLLYPMWLRLPSAERLPVGFRARHRDWCQTP